jgi:hypothetical protein
MDQRISKVEYFLSPPARSGSCVDFDVVRSQPITGRLFLQRGSDLSPVEYREVELLNAAGQRMTIPTGRGGEFYFAPDDFPAEVGTEPLVNGCDALIKPKEVGELSPRYRATLWIDDKERTFNLEVPVSDAIFIDLGKIVVAAEQAL